MADELSIVIHEYHFIELLPRRIMCSGAVAQTLSVSLLFSRGCCSSRENTPELSAERDAVVHLQRTRPSYQQKETLLFIYREHARAISRKRRCCSSTENTPELSAERDAVVH